MARSLVVGSPEHKELFCRFFMDSHVAFDPARIDWPVLDADSRQRLHSLPVWHEAVETERMATCTIETWAPQETDPLIREAVALQGYEEARHAAIIQGLTEQYGIPVAPIPPPQPPADAEWAFLRLGYSECFDAFFTFALFAIARDSGFFPAALVTKFETVMQEEARHILFFVNWEAYRQAQSPLWQRPRHLWRGVAGRVLQVWRRVQTALGARHGAKDFTMKGHQAIRMDITPRGFLELCLAENAQRMSHYDARLLRPRLMPGIAQALCKVLP
ncbi:MAG: ferritin-like domain-containing protein [Candidatus Tectomicrobia bacterium]|uniref:Ferritin-like domain-containing protein n=1 Tax=Tectimicrobiota bacterium TaxID=2528274 RepID=A0A938B3B1_UNCTE|nr:ferritin-like domain-containing protein [Candidatus Tectomicrobia bacterium]